MNRNHRTGILRTALLSAPPCLCVSLRFYSPMARLHAADRPNILWLIAEDFGPHLGCYGTKEVSTPNLDRLAAQGRALHAVLHDRAGLLAQPQRVHDRHVSDDDRRAQPPLAPRRRLPAAGGRARAHRLAARRGLLHGQHPRAARRASASTAAARPTGISPTRASRSTRDQWSDLKAHQPFFAQVNFQETHRDVSRADARRSGQGRDSAVLSRSSGHARGLGQVSRRRDRAGPQGRPDPEAARSRRPGRQHGRRLLRRQRPGPRPRQAVLLRERPARAADHPLAEELSRRRSTSRPARWTTGCSRRSTSAPTMLAIAGATKPAKMQGEVFLGDTAGAAAEVRLRRPRPLRRDGLPLPHRADDRYRYIRNFTPDRPFLQPNDYKERQYPVWNLLKELDAEGQAHAAAESPHRADDAGGGTVRHRGRPARNARTSPPLPTMPPS